MCSEHALNGILKRITECSKEVFSEKLVDVILYGSYARGDYTAESDIDVMIFARIDSHQIGSYLSAVRERIFHLEIENDCVISLSIAPYDVFTRYKNIQPFYKNISEEGMSVAG